MNYISRFIRGIFIFRTRVSNSVIYDGYGHWYQMQNISTIFPQLCVLLSKKTTPGHRLLSIYLYNTFITVTSLIWRCNLFLEYYTNFTLTFEGLITLQLLRGNFDKNHVFVNVYITFRVLTSACFDAITLK